MSEYVFSQVTSDHTIQAKFDATGGEWKLIMLDPNIRSVYSFNEGLALVDNKQGRGKEGYGYVNTSGELVLPCIYEEAVDFREGIAPVKSDGRWYLMVK